MTWLQRQWLQRFVRASFWLVPVACMAAAMAAAPAIRWIDAQTHWVLFGFTADGASEVVGRSRRLC
jgi:hypothetical protein